MQIFCTTLCLLNYRSFKLLRNTWSYDAAFVLASLVYSHHFSMYVLVDMVNSGTSLGEVYLRYLHIRNKWNFFDFQMLLLQCFSKCFNVPCYKSVAKKNMLKDFPFQPQKITVEKTERRQIALSFFSATFLKTMLSIAIFCFATSKNWRCFGRQNQGCKLSAQKNGNCERGKQEGEPTTRRCTYKREIIL